MRDDPGSRTVPPATYYYRRPLELRELVPAVGVAVGAGLAAFYLARLFLQRTALAREPRVAALDERGAIVLWPRPRSLPGAPGARAAGKAPRG
jgi:hypothetical protein